MLLQRSWSCTHAGDITAAFLQGAPIERTLLLRAPKDGIPTEKGEDIVPYTYLVALMSVYGSKDAPRGFWLELRKELVTQGLTEIDPAFYVLIDEGETCGLLCSHVDDLLWVGNPAPAERLYGTLNCTNCIGATKGHIGPLTLVVAARAQFCAFAAIQSHIVVAARSFCARAAIIYRRCEITIA